MSQDRILAYGTWPVNTDFSVVMCWSEIQGVSHCQLNFLPSILVSVIAWNVMKVICMMLRANYLWNLDESIPATVGDALRSSIEDPDDTTKDLRLVDFRARKGGKVWKPKRSLLSRIREVVKAYDKSWPLEIRKYLEGVSPMEAYDSYYRCPNKR